MPRPKSENVRNYILANLPDHRDDIASITALHFGVSRQAINRHLKSLESDGIILGTGKTRGREYELVMQLEETVWFDSVTGLVEDLIWRDHILPRLRGNKANVLAICQHAATEMINNVLEHAETRRFYVRVTITAATISMDVSDEGIGIFHKIQKALNQDDPRMAILELAKGKFTTDPDSHTGEGIFFTSRMCDEFAIMSDRVSFWRRGGEDWLLSDKIEAIEGTLVHMVVNRFTERTTSEVFSQYASEFDEYGFTRTHIPVRLAAYEGEVLVSRSQARRLLARFEKFKEVILDFTGVGIIGPAFADEVFRVFANEHSGTSIIHVNASKEVDKMIRRALAAKAAR